ncbi:MAG: glycosyltransferase family 4 protein [Gemmatimonadota bacterium]|nr:glycosyltransferase family 4 protein [Gemmatimonadota bacterium]
MKICIVSRALYPVIGGSETYAYNLGEYLSDRGHRVVVVTSDLPPHYRDDHGYPFEVARVQGLSDFNSARAPLSTLVPLYRLLASLRPDVIHVQSVLPGIALTLISDMLPGPPAIVFTDHNTPMPEQRRWISGVNCYEVELAFGQFMFKRGTYDAALAPSRRFYDWALRRGAPPEKLHLIRHGVDVNRFSPGVAPRKIRRALCPGTGKTVLLAPGRAVRRKGIMGILDALSSPLLASADVHLAITTTRNTSEPAFFEEVRSRIAASPLKERVTLLVDTFAPDDMPDVYRASDCVLFLSDAEGFGLVGIEALACGVPLIARESKGINEYFVHGETGWAVQGDSGHEIAAAVRRVREDGDLRSAVVRTGRRLAVSEFSLSSMIRKIERLYAAVVEQKRVLGPGVPAGQSARAATGTWAEGWH